MARTDVGSFVLEEVPEVRYTDVEVSVPDRGDPRCRGAALRAPEIFP
ncbi:hypothetical protein QJS66_04530 [Kocuria rhizophila]|nr:hypothetical protein QJS66_04530 [Kocuria rhizophila]